MDRDLRLFSAERENIRTSHGPLAEEEPCAEPHSASMTHQEIIDDLLYICYTHAKHTQRNGGGHGHGKTIRIIRLVGPGT